MEPQELDEAKKQGVDPQSSIEKKRERKVVCRLPNDMVMEIFRRLPVKYILRFICVSKAWNSIPRGVYARKMLPPAMTGLFFLHRESTEPGKYFARTRSYSDSPLVDTDLNFLAPGNADTVHMIDICNGLLLCGLENPDHHVIGNPATRKWSTLPEPEGPEMEVLKLGFDPQLSLHYRVLGLYQQPDSNGKHCYNMKFFLSEEGEWVDGEGSVKSDVTHERWKSVYLYGIFHFLDLFVEEDVIAGIDTEANDCQKIELPDYACDVEEGYMDNIGSSEGLLHYAMNTTNKFVVWVMKDYAGKKWELKHNISYQSIVKELEHPQFDFYPDGLEIRISEKLHLLEFHADFDVVFFEFEDAVISCQLLPKGVVRLALFCRPGPNYSQKAFVYSPCYLENLDI